MRDPRKRARVVRNTVYRVDSKGRKVLAECNGSTRLEAKAVKPQSLSMS